MIGVAHMAVHVAQMTGLQEIDGCFDMITHNGARSLHISTYGIQMGNPANLVVLGVTDPFSAIRYQVTPCYVISQGKVIAETQPAQTSVTV
jgi:cytosine deaminase